ncbi:hypothetical protein M5K25_018167 [Dendrobium thyrsiflorum]|uniref:Uncharacterized protein n=1 Tax=Dendrobium thyrsiflorum TaxID=117978 RepID=A0ABD0UPI4_DENTH
MEAFGKRHIDKRVGSACGEDTFRLIMQRGESELVYQRRKLRGVGLEGTTRDAKENKKWKKTSLQSMSDVYPRAIHILPNKNIIKLFEPIKNNLLMSCTPSNVEVSDFVLVVRLYCDV